LRSGYRSLSLTFRTADLEIDFAARRVMVAGKSAQLTPKEFDLLRMLVANPNKAIPHRKLLQTVWGPDYGDEVEYLRFFVNQLRKKIEPVPFQAEISADRALGRISVCGSAIAGCRRGVGFISSKHDVITLYGATAPLTVAAR
jgi:DNA-binding response OmpR family regulator